MTKAEFSDLVERLIRAFPGTAKPPQDAKEAWFEAVGDLDHQTARRAVEIIAREVEFLRPGHNLGALIRCRAVPVVTQATIENHLNFAVYLARTNGEDPYGYLRKVSPQLLELAERADLFARDLNTEAQGWRVRNVAAQFQERRENEKRGFSQAEPLPASRQLPAPGPMELTDEIRQKGLAHIRAAREKYGWKESGPAKVGTVAQGGLDDIKREEGPK